MAAFKKRVSPRRAIAMLIAVLLCRSALPKTLLEEFPHLGKRVYREPESRFLVGFALSPIALLRSRYATSAGLFQLHYRSGWLDYEIFGATLGFFFTSNDLAGSKYFLFRTVPKVRVLPFLSVGPLLGLEFVSFPSVQARLFKGGFGTPVEPFSSNGIVYGGVLAQTFDLGGGYVLKLSQLVYQQTYSTTEAFDGWIYVFEDPALQADPNRSLIKGSLVIMLEAALLF